MENESKSASVSAARTSGASIKTRAEQAPADRTKHEEIAAHSREILRRRLRRIMKRSLSIDGQSQTPVAQGAALDPANGSEYTPVSLYREQNCRSTAISPEENPGIQEHTLTKREVSCILPDNDFFHKNGRVMNFTEMDLHPDLKKGIDDAGYVSCMPVQAQVFPHAFAGEDIYAQSQTGTGKTAAFLVSIFQRILTVPELRTRKVLILAPTRELAVQIVDETKKLGKHLSISVGGFFGGVSYGPQVDMLKANVQILIGTPGRIIDLLQQGKMILKDVGFLVIDEADRMFDMGFIDDLRRLLRYLPPPDKRQTYLFSATLGERVRHLAWDYMREPKEIVIEPENVTVDLVTQEVHHVAANEKFRLLLGILRRDKPESAIIFCNQKYMVEEVARRLRINDIPCDFIMGDLPQSRRMEIIRQLKAGKLSILVATDVAARGLDIDALDMVINYDIPLDAESYVHRIGRTARAGKSGKAVTLACEKFVYGLPAIEEFINMKIPVAPFDDKLLEEDRSAGMHFGYSRDRGRNASGRRDDRDTRREPRREGRTSRRSDHGKSAPRPRTSAGPTRPEAASRRPSKRMETPKSSDLYNLPLEERMRLYKQKYAGQQDRASNSDASRREAPNSRRRPSEQRKGGAPRPQQSKDFGRPAGKAAARGAKASPLPKPSVRAPAPQKEASGEKKGVRGFLSRLFGKE